MIKLMIESNESMKIQKKLVKRGVDGKPFYKHYITMPVDAMNELGWQSGTEITWRTSGDKFIVEHA